MVRGNPGTIKTRFRILVAEKATREGRKITYTDIYKATGIATSTLTEWANGRVKLVSLDVLAALCNFFDCQIGDLLEYLPPTK